MFDLLEFKEHEVVRGGTRATHWFDNGYGVSVITGGYGTKDAPYELAVMDKEGLCYNTDITDDVLGYLTADEVGELMSRVEAL